tara:strand:+ start:2390 stop:2623 length:234 start_codon:yes stop_codon:yes gene_type:complete
MTWEDIIKNEKVELDSQSMHLPKYEKLKMMAIYDVLKNICRYSNPDEPILVTMKNIVRQYNKGNPHVRAKIGEGDLP